ncbi:uncharacterized protein LOC124386978 [Silurus meridionalis]|uniref:uncharacterized protein LOC124386978 n=1 Tax=Silurus meridionalis TaxID=175797 RepID=UPI001EEB2FB4|nr:uncharacterized protein LOC124386978 [Silurus meridionalis]
MWRHQRQSETTLIFISKAGVESADISIKPEETTLSVTEGSNITLSCTYTGSVYSLHWYQQKPGSRPEFLLLIDERIERVTEAQPPHPRDSMADSIDPLYTHKAVDEGDNVTLSCRYEITAKTFIMFTVIFMCLWLSLGDSMADSIKPLFTHEFVDEGDDVTLSCKYETSNTGTVLHWYRQHPKSKPVFLLYTDLFGGKTKPMPPRLDAEVNKTNKEVDLIISSAAVSDSALYYCMFPPPT